MRGILRRPEQLALPASATEGAQLALAYRRKIFWGLFWGNLVATFPSIVGTATQTGTDPDQRHAVLHAVILLIVDLVYLLLFWSGSAIYVRRVSRPLFGWLSEARPPTADERNYA